MPRLIVLKQPAQVTVVTKLLATPLTLNEEKTSSTCSNPWQDKEQMQQESRTNAKVCLHFINKAEQNSTQGPPKVLQTQFILESVLSSTTAKP